MTSTSAPLLGNALQHAHNLHFLDLLWLLALHREALGIMKCVVSGGGSLAAHLDDFYEAAGLPVLVRSRRCPRPAALPCLAPGMLGLLALCYVSQTVESWAAVSGITIRSLLQRGGC